VSSSICSVRFWLKADRIRHTRFKKKKARTGSFRDVYWVGVAFVAVVVLLITFLGEETQCERANESTSDCVASYTLSTDDRDVVPFPKRPTTGLRYRIETLLGITGWKMAEYRCSWGECLTSWLDVLWRPHALLMYIYVGVTFGVSPSLASSS